MNGVVSLQNCDMLGWGLENRSRYSYCSLYDETISRKQEYDRP